MELQDHLVGCTRSLVSEYGRGINYGAILLMQIRERHGMDLFSGAWATVEITVPKGEACIGDKIRPKPQISCHTYRSFDGIICAHARDYERLKTMLA